MDHPYLTMSETENIPLHFDTTEEAGELLPSEHSVLKGSVVNLNTKNSEQYRKYYDTQLMSYMKVAGKEIENLPPGIA